MIDNIALALTHGLLLVALIRLVRRSDLDREVKAEDAVLTPREKRRARGRPRA
ncbi:MAG: hypothetical protein ACR2FJ_01075 [Qipengyuania sp.]